jgi:3-deoxy-D-manno-octulosonic-acid transferase
MLAVGAIIEALHRDGVDVYLTTTTSTGFRLAQERYGRCTIAVRYFPIDWWPFVQRAWRGIDPDLMILAEGERWPEHLRQAAKRRVPVLSINTRLSDRSYARLKHFPAAARLMLGGVSRLCAASSDDAERFVALGFPRERIVITGNIKLDVQIPILSDPERSTLREELGLPNGLILLGSSTWAGEEAALVDALRRVRATGVHCSLLLVPRHAERRAEIQSYLESSGLQFHFRSRGRAAGPMDVTVADTTGELRRLTQLADLVFVGKSLPPHTEGQTPVEAAVLEKAIVMGHGMSNFRVIARDLVERGAAREVADAAGLAAACEELLPDPQQRGVLAQAAARWHRENAGAVERTLRVIREELAQISH